MLRSMKDLDGLAVEAIDGDIGHVQGCLVDDETWAIRYVVVNTSNGWLGHEVNIAREWIEDVRWSDASITVGRTREAVKEALLDEPSGELDRAPQRGLYSPRSAPRQQDGSSETRNRDASEVEPRPIERAYDSIGPART